MSELKAMTVLNVLQMGCYDNALVYFKYEADKVIAEKDKELRHHKYKRCLDKAEMCQARYDEEDAKVNHGTSWAYISEEMKYWERWRWRWDAIADKFKEATNGL